MVGGFYNVDLRFTDTDGDGKLSWDDANGNGEIDGGEHEPLAEPGDAVGAFDFGIVDVDASRAGNQEVRSVELRNGWEDMRRSWWATRNDAWLNQNATFTTGPGTTSVTVFVDNANKTGATRLRPRLRRPLRPAVDPPPDRTVAVRPADGATGTATIILTARDVTRPAGQQELGTETFTVTVVAGSNLTNGDFEAQPVGDGWELANGPTGVGAEVVVEDPFSLNRALELGGPSWQVDGDRRSVGTAFFRLTNLSEDTEYTLDFRGKGKVTYAVQGDGGPDVTGTVDSATWSPGTATFTTGSTTTTAALTFLDWDTADGPSLVDDVTLTPEQSTGLVHPPVTSPPLTGVGPQAFPSTAPATVPFSVPSGTTVTGVTSSNQVLVPDRNLGVNGDATTKVLSLTPSRGRTGTATITVAATGASGTHTHDIPVTVSHGRFHNPGFEQGTTNWQLPASAQVVSGDLPRSGDGALEIDGAGAVELAVIGLPYDTTFRLTGWSRGEVDVSITTVADPDEPTPEPTTSTTWSAGDWTANSIDHTTLQCASCPALGGYEGEGSTLFASHGGEIRIAFTDADPDDG